MLRIKKTTTALIDIDVERARISQALPNRTQKDILAKLMGILTYVERFDVKGAAAIYEKLPDNVQQLVNPYIAEMLLDYGISTRLRATPYAITAPKYDILPANPDIKKHYHS